MATTQNLKIDGITGFGHFAPFERLRGRMDARQHQIRALDNGFTSPWIMKKAFCCDRYINRLYLIAAERMQQSHRNLYSVVQELREINNYAFPEKHSSLPEQDLRFTTLRARRIENSRHRASELRMSLADIESAVDWTDATLRHDIERAEALLRTHVSSYWEGVLCASAGESDLPVSPVLRNSLPDQGEELYRLKRDQVLALIAEAKKCEDVNKED